MLFSHSNHINFDSIVVHEPIINRVPNTKFLGLYIDDELSWSYHIEK